MLTFLAAHNQNINKLDLVRVFWTSKDKDFYDARLLLTDCTAIVKLRQETVEFLAPNRTFQAMAPLLNHNHKRAADSCLGDAALGRSELNRPTCVCAESADEARHISVCVAQWRAPGFAQD